MNATFPLGRPAGIRVGAHWSVLLIMAPLAGLLAQSLLPAALPGLSPAVYWATGTTGAVVLLASLLVHELSHALAARDHGLVVDGITLWLLGGSTEPAEEPATPRTAMAVAIAGPVASLTAGAGFLVAGLLSSGIVAPTLTWLGWTNLALASFALLPGAPPAGGRVLQAIVWQLTGDRRRARAATARSGAVLGVVLASAGLLQSLWSGTFTGLWLAGFGWFLALCARAEQTTE
ncbi:site-2 protease family protein [Amycolatopsis kentuckyensis]|uniref:site-2 protease family protein n=1 Tax=Amycolatopsis kentuckyensis TaxID=218823 RepID=UPI000A3C52D9|nr:site-2 protease family protein [Amycolatopsis kentuckyensis]